MKTSATSKFIGTSSRKIGLVAQLIRGRRVNDAVALLEHTPKRATDPVGKTLASAIANAENNHNARKNDLVVESVFVGPGPSLKRFRPRAKGSAGSIKKRSSHITVIVSDALVTTPTKNMEAAQEAPKTKTVEAKTEEAK
jgi:large subunit ribosomal protein L22